MTSLLLPLSLPPLLLLRLMQDLPPVKHASRKMTTTSSTTTPTTTTCIFVFCHLQNKPSGHRHIQSKQQRQKRRGLVSYCTSMT